MSGLFLTFEGPEGAGKSTQIAILAAAIRADGYRVTQTREPGGTPVGECVRDILLNTDFTAMAPETEALLHTAARAQHVRDIIRPALFRGDVVLCDRFIDSTLAYQGGGSGVPVTELLALQRLAVGDTLPRIRFLLDLPVEIGLGRRRRDAGTLNKMDVLELDFHERVREAYLSFARAFPDGWIVIDARRPRDEIAEEIQRAVRGLIAESGERIARHPVVPAQ